MENNLNFRNESDKEVDSSCFIKVIQAFRQKGLLEDQEISVLIKNDLREINKKYRGLNKTTDVISFPAQDLPEEIPFLGDIVIDINQVAKQKEESIENELQTLFTHGILHLLGYNHLSKNDRAEMKKLENEIKNLIRSL